MEDNIKVKGIYLSKELKKELRSMCIDKEIIDQLDQIGSAVVTGCRASDIVPILMRTYTDFEIVWMIDNKTCKIIIG